jgi:cathepsin L
MKSFVAFLLVLVTVANAASFAVLSEDVQWLAWKTYHKKSYSDEYEERFRRGIWVYNLKVCSLKTQRIFAV